MNFTENDKLGLKPFSEKLEKFLMVEHDFVEGSLVVGLDAPFGTGKTTFLSMWKETFDRRAVSDQAVPKALIINAWENDYCGDPLLSIVSALIKAAEKDGSEKVTGTVSRLREAVTDVGWFATSLTNNLAAHWSGVDPISAGKFADEKRKERLPKVPDFVALYEERCKALAKLKSALQETFGGESPKAFLFIDELDRCRPDYAVNYLETIKHVFDVHGLVFVLAVDLDQLESSAKALFGSGLKFSDYFRKFAQRTFSIPDPTEQSLNSLTEYYIRYYLEREGKRISMIGVGDQHVSYIVELIAGLKMPPRQIQEMFRIIGHTASTDNSERRGRIYFFLGIGIILMAALKVADSKMYRKMPTMKSNPREFVKFLTGFLDKEKAKWWFSIYITGTLNESNQEWQNIAGWFKEFGFVEANSIFSARNELGQFTSDWGPNSINRWKQIYEKMEAATTF